MLGNQQHLASSGRRFRPSCCASFGARNHSRPTLKLTLFRRAPASPNRISPVLGQRIAVAASPCRIDRSLVDGSSPSLLLEKSPETITPRPKNLQLLALRPHPPLCSSASPS